MDSSVERVDGRSLSPSISPSEQITTTPEMTPDRVESVSPTPQKAAEDKNFTNQCKRPNKWYFDGFHPMKPTLKRKLRRRKLSKELDQLVDCLDIDEGPPPSKIALSRTRYNERR